MATANEIDKIVLEIEQRGAAGAYLNVKRLDDATAAYETTANSAARAASKLGESLALAVPPDSWVSRMKAFDAYTAKQDRKHERNQAMESSRQDAKALQEAMAASRRIPTELQQAPQTIDWAAALEAQSTKAGSAIEAAAHSALEEATAIGEAAQHAQKLSSVYDLIAKRAKAAAREDAKLMAAKQGEVAGKQASLIGRLEAEAKGGKLTGGQKFVQFIGKAFGPKAVKGLTTTVEAVEKYGPAVAKVAPLLGGAAAAVGAVGIGAAYVAGKLAKEGAAQVIEAQAYREDLFEAFKTVRRTQGDAAKVMGLATRTADQLGMGRAEGAGQFLDLLTKFGNVKTVDKIVRSFADLGTVDPNANIEGLAKALGKMQGQGKLTGEVLQSLNDNGLEMGDVYGQLAKSMGKDFKDIPKLISSGKVDSEAGLNAILAAINAQVGGGAAGAAAAAKADRNLSSLLKRVEDIPKNVLFDVAAGPGLDSVKGFLRDILETFSATSVTGRETRKVVGDLFNALMTGLLGTNVDYKKGAGAVMRELLKAAKDAVPVVKDVASAIHDMVIVGAGIAGAVAQVHRLRKEYGWISDIVDGLSDVSGGLFWDTIGGATPIGIVGKLYHAIKAVAAVMRGDFKGAGEEMVRSLPFGSLMLRAYNARDSIKKTIDGIGGTIKTGGAVVLNAAKEIGSNIWQGIITGFSAGIDAITSAVSGAAQSALDAAKGVLKIHSPSRAFAEVGMYSAMGMGLGFDRGAGAAASSAAAMASTALGAAWTAGSANGNGGAAILAGPGAGGAGGGVTLNFSPTILVSGASSPQQAQAIGAAAVRGAREQWEAQLGATMRRLRYG